MNEKKKKEMKKETKKKRRKDMESGNEKRQKSIWKAGMKAKTIIDMKIGNNGRGERIEMVT